MKLQFLFLQTLGIDFKADSSLSVIISMVCPAGMALKVFTVSKEG
jgi:hypothetical protein